MNVAAKNLQQVILAGKQMANCCYNLSNCEALSEPMRQTLREVQEQWDAALGYVDYRHLGLVAVAAKRRRKSA